MSLAEQPPGVGWVRQNRTRYSSLLGLYMATIERQGVRWHTTLISIINGEIIELETRSPLSVAIQQAENRAAEPNAAHTKREENNNVR